MQGVEVVNGLKGVLRKILLPGGGITEIQQTNPLPPAPQPDGGHRVIYYPLTGVSGMTLELRLVHFPEPT